MSSTDDRDDFEIIVWNYVRKQYENKYNKQQIPIALKYIISKFSKRLIPCTLLTFKEDLEFHNLLMSKLSATKNTTSYKVLYKASDNSYSSQEFHHKCARELNTVTIIKSKSGNIFGGYRSTKFDSNLDEETDSFLFLIRTNDEQTLHQAFLPKYHLSIHMVVTEVSTLEK